MHAIPVVVCSEGILWRPKNTLWPFAEPGLESFRILPELYQTIVRRTRLAVVCWQTCGPNQVSALLRDTSTRTGGGQCPGICCDRNATGTTKPQSSQSGKDMPRELLIQPAKRLRLPWWPLRVP